MTWGCNATGIVTHCRFCGRPDVDDRDEGPSTHEIACAPMWWRWLHWMGLV